MADIKYHNVTELKGKMILITKAEKDNLEFVINGEKFFIYPMCRSCEYNDEVFIFGESSK
jgi:hypothetical protein